MNDIPTTLHFNNLVALAPKATNLKHIYNAWNVFMYSLNMNGHKHFACNIVMNGIYIMLDRWCRKH